MQIGKRNGHVLSSLFLKKVNINIVDVFIDKICSQIYSLHWFHNQFLFLSFQPSIIHFCTVRITQLSIQIVLTIEYFSIRFWWPFSTYSFCLTKFFFLHCDIISKFNSIYFIRKTLTRIYNALPMQCLRVHFGFRFAFNLKTAKNIKILIGILINFHLI